MKSGSKITELACYYYGCMAALLIGIGIALAVAVLLVIPIIKADESSPLCDFFEELSHQEGVTVATWIGYPDGWKDYPDGWDYETYTPLTGETGILSKVSGRTRWLWGFKTLTEDNGNHDFCEHVLIIADSP